MPQSGCGCCDWTVAAASSRSSTGTASSVGRSGICWSSTSPSGLPSWTTPRCAAVARNLCRLFWRDLEVHHPGIDSLRLSPQVAQAWKERLAYIRDADDQPVRPRVNYRSELVLRPGLLRGHRPVGRRRPGPLGALGGAVPDQGRGMHEKKARSRVKSRMDQRTRTQLPLLPALLRAVEQQRKDAEERINTARDRRPGTGSPLAGQDFQRCRPVSPAASTPST